MNAEIKAIITEHCASILDELEEFVDTDSMEITVEISCDNFECSFTMDRF